MFRPPILLLLATGISFAQIDALRAEIRDAYFKEPRMDLIRARDFFIEVQKKPNVVQYVEALRAEIEDRTNPERMRADASSRLLNLSDKQENWKLVAGVLSRLSLQEVGITPYYALVKRLAGQNVDISLAAFQLLDQPDVRMNWISPFSFDQAELVASLLLPTDVDYWANAAIERLSSERDETAQRTLLNLLWYAQTDFADDVLSAFAKDPKKPVALRALAEELFSLDATVSATDRTEVMTTSEELLKERRRQRQAAGIYFEQIMPTMKRDTMKILLKRRLTSRVN